MRKIPTLFRRDPDDMRRVLPIVQPGCEWVLAGEGVATRKYDGTCVSWHDNDWWFRREVKPGKRAPMGFVEVEHDPVTDKCVGWEPARPESGFIKLLREAIDNTFTFGQDIPEGTYELCGPKVNRNPEGYDEHRLARHADAEIDVLTSNGEPRDFDGCRARVIQLGERGWEGIVWWREPGNPDAGLAKLKARDFQ